ncbi:MAG: cadherin repeat domain-containing protein, partial [Gemmatimonadetes bacterium]|nr:cadherin repeat domain-containing protein [Gemmatimonadota bacterium]
MVSIDVEGVGLAGRVTETLPAGFTYVSTTSALPPTENGSELAFRILGNSDFSYTVTASSTEGPASFSGSLIPGPGMDAVAVGGASTVTVATTPPQTGPAVTTNNLDFDVVPSKAVKGATVSGVGNPISSNPLMWVVDNSEGMTLGDFDGSVGDFEVVETEDGDEFILKVATSGAPNLSGSMTFNVTLPYTNGDGEVGNSILSGTITERDVLNAPASFTFTVPQNVASDTPLGSFDVTGRIDDDDKKESLDGIVNGGDAAPFGVNDADMTIYRRNGADLEVRDYNFTLTVNGDAGLAARADRADVTIKVTASNDKHSAPDTFTATIYENIKGAGLVSADTAVGDASAGITNPDGDKLTYSEDSPLFEINEDTGAVTVGPNDIGDDMSGPQHFHITVSDGVTANNAVIEATVMVDANEPVMAKSSDLPDRVTKAADSDTYTVTTLEVAGTVNGYHILNVSDLVTLDLDADGNTEMPEYTPSVRTAPLNVDDEGRLLLTHVPRGFQDGVEDHALPSITVEIDDGYNPSITITIDVVLNVKEKPDQITPSLAASIDENMTGEVQAALSDLDSSGNDTLGRLIDLISDVESDGDGVEYKHTGGTNGGEPGAGAIFSVDSGTGAISLNTAQDADMLSAMPSVVLQVERDSDGADLGVVFVAITINNVNEAPMFMAGAPSSINVDENVQPNTMIDDAMITATDQDAGDSITYSIEESDVPFTVNSATGQLSVSGALVLDDAPYSVTLVATDDGEPVMMAEHTLTITIGDVNDPPMFDNGAATTASIYENAPAGTVVATYNASDDDGDDVHEDIHYELRNADDLKNFAIEQNTTADGERVGMLVVKEGANLDVDADGAATSYT